MGWLAQPAAAWAEQLYYNPRTTYGEVGLLDMPSAHLDPDGELSMTVSVMPGTRRFNAAFDVLPWLEGSFRYAMLFAGPKSRYDRSFGMKVRLLQETEDLPDLSLGLRDILGTGIYGGEYLVASKQFGRFDATVGVGWGRFAQSNALPNPFAELFPSFKNRPLDNSTTGTVNFGEFFHGPKIGVFGGVIWRTPIDNLDVIAEYSSDRYDFEAYNFGFHVRSPVNLGVSYSFYDQLLLSAGWYYGANYGVTLTVLADPTKSMAPQHIGPDLPIPNIRTPQEQIQSLNLLFQGHDGKDAGGTKPWAQLDRPEMPMASELRGALFAETGGVLGAETVGHTLLVEASLTRAPTEQCASYARIVRDIDPDLQFIAISNLRDPSGAVQTCRIVRSGRVSLAEAVTTSDSAGLTTARQKILGDIDAQHIRTEALSIEGATIWLYISNNRYWTDDEAVGRAARILMADAPPTVEVFHIVPVEDGLPLHEFLIARSALERAATVNATSTILGNGIEVSTLPLSNPVLEHAQDETYPRYSWAIKPGLHEGLFDPNRPFQIQLFASATGGVLVTPHLSFDGRVEANIFNNFDYSTPSDSVLPHVRSDALQYFKYGSNGISDLRATYVNRLTPTIVYGVRAGYLENMFAGAGGQILWRPEDQRFAIGVDAYEVWQRNFDRLFGVQKYHILTGHVTLYYQSPYYDLNFKVHVGRYLAGDYGATFEVTRQFSSGVEVGAFATFTNVPFSKFGEGSFDKGILLRVPLEWALPFFSRTSYNLTLRSLTRDGGQRLDFDDFLYEETRPSSYGELIDHVDDIVSP